MAGIGGPRTLASLIAENHEPENLEFNRSKYMYKPESYRPPPVFPDYHPFTRSKTTYAGMNDWMLADREKTNVPPTITDQNWKHKGPARDTSYEQLYRELISKRAYRFPNPGPPRKREGNVGASWRHIKEVPSYSGSKVYYVDGIVGLYDSTSLNQKLASRSLPLAPSYGTPLFAMNRNDVSGYRKQRDYNLERQKFKPWLMENTDTINPLPQPLPSIPYAQPPNIDRTGGSTGYKGFYQRNA